MNEIETFIYNFKHIKSSIIEDLFLYGDCYYFSIILQERFSNSKKVITKYLTIDNHFVTEIDGQIYDIRGNITDIIDKNQLVTWSDYKTIDETHYNRIIRDCINF